MSWYPLPAQWRQAGLPSARHRRKQLKGEVTRCGAHTAAGEEEASTSGRRSEKHLLLSCTPVDMMLSRQIYADIVTFNRCSPEDGVSAMPCSTCHFGSPRRQS